MDLFLRRVIAQREAEQERAILDVDFAAGHCLVCDKSLNMTMLPGLRVCSGCGGRRRQDQIEQQERQAEQAERARSNALAIAGFGGSMGAVAVEDEGAKNCSNCGKAMRVSRSGTYEEKCFRCRLKADRGTPTDSSEKPTARGSTKETLKTFRQVASALGYDPDRLLETFAKGWLGRAREATAPLAED